MTFECHITVQCLMHRIDFLRSYIETYGWSFSRIAGDPLLGDFIFCYATNHFDKETDAHKHTMMVSEYLIKEGFDVRRRKIEKVVLDQRLQKGIWNTIV